jgi:cytochrome c oxidase assembly factor CtaG
MMNQMLILNSNPALCCAAGAFLFALLYGIGLARLWRRAGRGRGVSIGRFACLFLGWSAATLPAVSAMHVLGRRVFVIHMLEHETLMVIAAPLLILSRPLPILLWALPAAKRHAVRTLTYSQPAQMLWRWLTDIRHATAIQGAALWLWHWPPLFQTALIDESVHTAQHLSFLLGSLLFWWSVLAPRAQRTGCIAGVFALFVTTLHSSLLGAWVTLSRGFWYSEPYLGTFCGLTRVQDQQLAGLVMWIPASVIYVGAAVYLLGRALTRGEHHAAAYGTTGGLLTENTCRDGKLLDRKIRAVRAFR